MNKDTLTRMNRDTLFSKYVFFPAFLLFGLVIYMLIKHPMYLKTEFGIYFLCIGLILYFSEYICISKKKKFPFPTYISSILIYVGVVLIVFI